MRRFSFRKFTKKNNYKKEDSAVFLIISAICFLTVLSILTICYLTLDLSNISIYDIFLLMFCVDVLIVYGVVSLVLSLKVETYIRLAEFEEYMFECIKKN